jgi:RNA methyltransferase, TrmH family
VAEALASGAPLRELFVAENVASLDSLSAAARNEGVPVIEVTEPVLRSLADTTTPQGVVAVVEIRKSALGELAGKASLLLVLAGVRDPGNAGTLLRSALAAGADGVVFAAGAVDPLHPKTVRASAGAVFRVEVAREKELAEVVGVLRREGLAVVGADASAPERFDHADFTRRIALVLGNESWGLGPDAGTVLDEVVGIPMPGPAESLNVGIAGSILLFECVRQRRLSSPHS